jgi:lipoic acid synthetase
LNFKPKVKATIDEVIEKTNFIIKQYNLNTICFSSKCPNISECFSRGVATFMILGNICTKNCRFCNVTSAKPFPIDKEEPLKIAKAVKYLNLDYVVITSPDRDDLNDYGSSQFVEVVEEITKIKSDIKIEVLTPSFEGDLQALQSLVNSNAYKLSHNIETTENLHKHLKPKSDYKLSLDVLEFYSKYKLTKSSIIVGFRESIKDLKATFKDLANAGVKQLTIGQYLQPSPKHVKVAKYYTDEEFNELELIAKEYFENVVSGKLVRSSYYADKL